MIRMKSFYQKLIGNYSLAGVNPVIFIYYYILDV